MSDPLAWLDDALAERERMQLRRVRVPREGPQSARAAVAGRQLVNFSSNDYLGLAGDGRLAAAAKVSLQDHGYGAGASPLISGYAAEHQRLEQALAEFEGAAAALLFTSGYAANVGTIPALVGRGDAIFSDALNHASIVDGCRLARAQVFVYRHADPAHLQKQLGEATGFRRQLIVTDSVFSMHGDFAPLADLAELAQRYGCMLMVDEAHATGVLGPRGRGLCEAQGVEGAVHVRVGTLSKALGACGGFVCGSRSLIEWLVNMARSYVFSTAAPAANSAAAREALRIVREEPWRRETLLSRAADLRQQLVAQGWRVGGQAQIMPLVVGDAARAMQFSNSLRQRGLWVPGIRPPSVPAGESLLRITLSHAHTAADIELLCTALAELARSEPK